MTQELKQRITQKVVNILGTGVYEKVRRNISVTEMTFQSYHLLGTLIFIV